MSTKQHSHFEVVESRKAKIVHNGARYTEYHRCPEYGFTVVAYGRFSPCFLTRALPEPDAERVFDQLLQAIGNGAKTFDVSAVLRKGESY